MNIDIHLVIHRNKFENQELCGASIMKNIHVFSNIDITPDISFNTKKIFDDDSDVTFYKCTFSYIRPFKLFRVKRLTFRNCNFTQMNSFRSMFYNNKWLKGVRFISCKIETIKDMSLMFSKCKSLESVQFIDSKTTSLRIIDYMFQEVGIKKILTGAAIANPASWRLMEKLGFKRLANQNRFVKDTFVPEEVEIYTYELSKGD